MTDKTKREEKLVVKKGAPPTKLLREVEEREEERAEGIARAVEKFAKLNIPRFTGNVLALATGGVTLFLLFSSLKTMMPYVTQVYAQFGQFLGFMVPFTIIFMMLSIMVGFAKLMTIY